jgi:dinuclear metal center YbgI/SA1388 family protein
MNEKRIYIKDVIRTLEDFAPPSLAEDWDNVGLQVGGIEKQCSGVAVCLDVTKSVVDQAVENGCNLVVSHHPFFFSAFKSIDTSTARGALTEKLFKNDITVYSAHTNLDVCKGGICEYLAVLFDGKNIRREGLGVVCDVGGLKLDSLAKKVAKVLDDNSVRMSGGADAAADRAYIIGGGGSSTEALETAISCADVFITGDVKHHVYIEATEYGFPVIEFSHFSSEIIAEDILETVIAANFDGIKVIKAKQQRPFRTLEEI